MASYTKTVREDPMTLIHLQIESDSAPSQTSLAMYKKYVASGEITELEAERVVSSEREVQK